MVGDGGGRRRGKEEMRSDERKWEWERIRSLPFFLWDFLGERIEWRIHLYKYLVESEEEAYTSFIFQIWSISKDEYGEVRIGDFGVERELLLPERQLVQSFWEREIEYWIKNRKYINVKWTRKGQRKIGGGRPRRNGKEHEGVPKMQQSAPR